MNRRDFLKSAFAGGALIATAKLPSFGGRQEEALRDSLAWAKSNVDYVIHTGDLIDWQSRANFMFCGREMLFI